MRSAAFDPYPRPMARLAAPATVLALALLSGTGAQAQAQVSDTTRTVDPVRGTIKGSTRYIGLAGAFTAIADDTEGVPINPASVAVRLPHSWNEFSYAFGVDFSVATWLPKNDIYNAPQGNSSESGSLFGSVGAVFNYGHAGFGLTAEAEQNAASQQGQGVDIDLTANFGLVHLVAAYGYFDGQLLLGAGLRIVGFSFDSGQSVVPLTAGVGYTAGLIIKPKAQPFRIGVALKQPINARIDGEPGAPAELMDVPWTASLGFAYQFGKRKLNPPFISVRQRARSNAAGREPTSEDEKKAAQQLFQEYEADQKPYLLVSTDLALIEGGGDVAVGDYIAIDSPLISPRLGFETEVVPRYLRLRVGSYLELPTTEGADARVHGTGGVDIKLFRWNVFGLVHPFDYWQLSLAADGAKSYLNTSFSVGFWH